MNRNIDRELDALQHEVDHERDSGPEKARRLSDQIAEHAVAIARLRDALPDLEDRAAGELATGAPATHSAALRTARNQIREREEDLALLREARVKAQRREAEQQVRRMSRVEARLRPLFVQTISELDQVIEHAEALNHVLDRLHRFSQSTLGADHGLSQGYGFASLHGWRERVKSFVRKPAA